MQRSNNIFPLPFTEDIDLTGFDNRVEISNIVSFDLIRLKDEIIVDLNVLRSAKKNIDQCLKSIK